jgi:hypothetical protein
VICIAHWITRKILFARLAYSPPCLPPPKYLPTPS